MPDILSRRKLLQFFGAAAVASGVTDLGKLFPGVNVASAQSYTDPIILLQKSSSNPPSTGYTIYIEADNAGPDVTLVAEVPRNVYYLLNSDGTEVEGSLKPLISEFIPTREGTLVFPIPINMIEIVVGAGNAVVVVGSPRQAEDVLGIGLEIPPIEFTENPGGINDNYGLRVIFTNNYAPRTLVVHSFDNIFIDLKSNPIKGDTYISSAALSGRTFTANDSDFGNYRLYDSDGNLVMISSYFSTDKMYLFDAAHPERQWLIQDINTSWGMADVVNTAAHLNEIMQSASDSTDSFVVPKVAALSVDS